MPPYRKEQLLARTVGEVDTIERIILSGTTVSYRKSVDGRVSDDEEDSGSDSSLLRIRARADPDVEDDAFLASLRALETVARRMVWELMTLDVAGSLANTANPSSHDSMPFGSSCQSMEPTPPPPLSMDEYTLLYTVQKNSCRCTGSYPLTRLLLPNSPNRIGIFRTLFASRMWMFVQIRRNISLAGLFQDVSLRSTSNDLSAANSQTFCRIASKFRFLSVFSPARADDRIHTKYSAPWPETLAVASGDTVPSKSHTLSIATHVTSSVVSSDDSRQHKAITECTSRDRESQILDPTIFTTYFGDYKGYKGYDVSGSGTK
ncbi:hypothetical protein AXG93_3017s1240 [Marchantia polymorpha subsp. ruderalis]|uniref:Uncharacterized protein n=1 Tax=Marchantia polymorpha subsp. ruderalis TaxID=1480154 RepID=A0A176WHJ0_MARPO|nr:hypothetical protein AXG93_3017s1240 [Marchantia polymorpha subsp. ruderalis]